MLKKFCHSEQVRHLEFISGSTSTRCVSFGMSLILCLVLLFQVSCKKQESTSAVRQPVASQANRITIGFSIDTLAIERWQRDMDVFINKAKEMGADVIVQNAGNSIEEQNHQLMYLLERNVDAVVVLPQQESWRADGS